MKVTVKKLTVALVLALFLAQGQAIAQEATPNWQALSNAIFQAEGGREGELYGIHSVPYDSEEEAKAICIRTCKHKWLDWLESGKKEPYLTYLSKKYCPKHPARWLKNVKFYLAKFEAQYANA